MIPRSARRAPDAASELGQTAALARAGLLVDPLPALADRLITRGDPVVVAVRDLIAELERRAHADEPVLQPRRHLHLVPRPAD